MFAPRPIASIPPPAPRHIVAALRVALGAVLIAMVSAPARTAATDAAPIDYNRDIRPILSQNCFICHGPDDAERKGGNKGGLRLDTLSGQREDLGGYAAVLPGQPDESELYLRLVTTRPHDLMPPPELGKTLTGEEIARVRRWIEEGASFSQHWSYVKPVRPSLPDVANPLWVRNEIDRFILARLDREGLAPQPEADRPTLARRLALDLTGLPPTPDDVDEFVRDTSPDAYERLVDTFLARYTYGEHWARLWLDLARYADSAGYADDPPRTIWAYRDYVIRAFNRNLPFDQFTLEQLAGDLLPDPTEDQIVATAFHRNTMTNSEGGTSDEEFRNVAVVDRVNTTFDVWMGTSMACAQCHTHKYDPITQKEYFEAFAFFNNTADADRPDEAPVHEFFTEPQQRQRERIELEFAELNRKFRSPDPEWIDAARTWARTFPIDLPWRSARPSAASATSTAPMQVLDDDSVLVTPPDEPAREDAYTVELPFDSATLVTGLRLEALPHEALDQRGPGLAGDFRLRTVRARLLPVPNQPGPSARFIRIELPGRSILQLAEVEVFSKGDNLAPRGTATQSSTYGDATADRAIDGDTTPQFDHGSVAHTREENRPWWEVDLGAPYPVERIVVWNRAEAADRLKDFRVVALDADRRPVWAQGGNPVPSPSAAFDLTGPRTIEFATAAADHNAPRLDEALVVADRPRPARPNPRRASAGEKGWGIGDATGQAHALTLVPAAPIEIPPGATLILTLEHKADPPNHALGRFRLGFTTDARVAEVATTPVPILAALRIPEDRRNDAQHDTLVDYFLRHVSPGWQTERDRWAELERQREGIKPHTVPVMRELEGDKRRRTHVQLRGDFMLLDEEVSEGVPAAWHPLPEDAPRNRLTLARWLVSEDNPLTARVLANRYWEQIFGHGIVRSSEEFGSQGEPPTHPELLDWLACQVMADGWDLKQLLRRLVTSATYRQSSRVTPENLEKDPDNVLLSRGPRFRLAAEAIRDHALASAGLLSSKRYGPSVRPVRPNLDLRAAFGGNLDWQPSQGEDRYRRGLYTEWRRTSPYPSMATFDAPSREVCTLRRDRSNTPLQALVTLNDPVFIEAAQGLARRMVRAAASPSDRIRHGFRLVLARPPSDREIEELSALHADVRQGFAHEFDRARALATDPLGPPDFDIDLRDLAAWTAVANVLLNLDETLMKR